MTRFASHPHALVVIRHGETDWNARSVIQGRQDIPLNDVGRAQARRNGEALKARFDRSGEDPAAWDFVSSTLSRAAETMRIVREAMGLDPLAFRTDARLVEIDFGAWSGLDRAGIVARDPEEWALRQTNQWSHRPPEGESAEDAMERAGAVLSGLDRPTVMVTHGGLNRVIKVLLGALTVEATRGFHTPQDRFYAWSKGVVEWV